MPQSMAVKMAQRGIITLPNALRKAYHIEPGDILTILDLDGVFVLSPTRLETDALAERITERLKGQGETLESMLDALRKERDRRAQEG